VTSGNNTCASMPETDRMAGRFVLWNMGGRTVSKLAANATQGKVYSGRCCTCSLTKFINWK